MVLLGFGLLVAICFCIKYEIIPTIKRIKVTNKKRKTQQRILIIELVGYIYIILFCILLYFLVYRYLPF